MTKCYTSECCEMTWLENPQCQHVLDLPGVNTRCTLSRVFSQQVDLSWIHCQKTGHIFTFVSLHNTSIGVALRASAMADASEVTAANGSRGATPIVTFLKMVPIGVTIPWPRSSHSSTKQSKALASTACAFECSYGVVRRHDTATGHCVATPRTEACSAYGWMADDQNAGIAAIVAWVLDARDGRPKHKAKKQTRSGSPSSDSESDNSSGDSDSDDSGQSRHGPSRPPRANPPAKSMCCAPCDPSHNRGRPHDGLSQSSGRHWKHWCKPCIWQSGHGWSISSIGKQCEELWSTWRWGWWFQRNFGKHRQNLRGGDSVGGAVGEGFAKIFNPALWTRSKEKVLLEALERYLQPAISTLPRQRR